MNVRELIIELRQYPLEAEVYLSKKDCPYSWRCTMTDDYDIDIDGCITLSNEERDPISDRISANNKKFERKQKKKRSK